jgi:hypothetical protein
VRCKPRRTIHEHELARSCVESLAYDVRQSRKSRKSGSRLSVLARSVYWLVNQRSQSASDGSRICATVPNTNRPLPIPCLKCQHVGMESTALTLTALRSLSPIGPIGCRAIAPPFLDEPGCDLRGEFLCLPHDRIQFREQRGKFVRCQVGLSADSS